MGLMETIKKEAERNGTKIQSSEEAELEQKLNTLFYLDKNIPEELKFLKSVMTRGQDTAERKGLHASAIIVPDNKFCYRQQVLSLFYKQAQGEQVSSGLKRIFSEGDSIHEKWQRLFIRGNLCKPLDCDYSLFNEEYDLSYTPDIICQIGGIKHVVEIKSMNTYAYKKQDHHASGRKQLQLYMYLTDIHQGFTLCEDKNTQDFKVRLYKYNPEEIQPYIARLEQIQYHKKRLENKGRLVRRHPDCNSPVCKRALDCPMKQACYKIKLEKLG